MKKMLKIISVFCIACIVISMSALVSQATATSTMSCKTSLNVGDTLSVTVKFVAGTEDNEIYGVEGTLLYNTSVLSFVSCSEVATVKDSGITFSGSGSGSASKTVTFNFKAISLGNSYTRTNSCRYYGNNGTYNIESCGVTIKVSEPTITTFGTLETDLQWKLSKNGILTISGSGKMPDFTSAYTDAPWYAYKNEITSVVIENGITYIGNYAFNQMTLLNTVSLPESVTAIGESAFASCPNLKSINIPDSVIEIRNKTFYNCAALEAIELSNVISIGDYAFYRCAALKNISLTNTVYIGDFSFRQCVGLVTVSCTDKLSNIGEGAFYGCTALETFVLPEDIAFVDETAFDKCALLNRSLDINNDGEINASDLTLMKKMLLGASPVTDVSDINGDGKFDILDFIRLKKRLAQITEENKRDIAQVISYTAETFSGSTTDDYSDPRNNYLPQGTIDYYDSNLIYNSSAGTQYAKLRCGRRVYTNKITTYRGILPDHNELSVASFSVSGKHTTLVLNTLWKAPFLLDILPQAYTNPSSRDFTVSDVTYEYIDITFCYASVFEGKIEIPESNPLFDRAKIINENTDILLRLYLKKQGAFYGWDSYYNDAGQLCFEFLNPASTVSADNDYGVNLTGVKILIDPGHGGVQPGTVKGSVTESQRNLILSEKIKTELESIGATVVMTRSDDTDISSDDRCKLLKSEKPDLCISVHHNSSTSSSANGFEAYHFNAFSSDPATFIKNQTAQTDVYLKSAVKWHVFFLARISTCPVVLTENGYFSNESDYADIIDENINLIKAKAIVQGIANYFISIGTPD